MKRTRVGRRRWSLADLIDFEALLASEPEDGFARDRMIFARDIRPQLPAGDALARRRRGLRLWLESRRERQTVAAGAFWSAGLSLARLLLFVAMGVAGFGLVAGLFAGRAQAVHVVVFAAVTLVAPWGLFLAWALVHGFGGLGRQVSARLLGVIIRLGERVRAASRDSTRIDWRARLNDGAHPRRAVGAAMAEVLQWGALGFNFGLMLAFVGSLMVFDVRFYWEATPRTDVLVETAAEAMAMPWAWIWSAAVPDTGVIEASRARYVNAVKRVPDNANASAVWWRFLLMSVLVWGALPRLVLIALYRWRLRRALDRLDFQAPRHRALWRTLSTVERGAAAPVATDGALVLDVGGIRLAGADIRGFLLRALRLNPQADHRVAVLDEAAEAAADAALAKIPDHVVMLVEDWGLSPRQAARLHARVRAAAGTATPMTWVVLGIRHGDPAAPDGGHLQRWTRFIDSLRDPATEVVAYEPDA